MTSANDNRRVLLVDDMPAIHDDFRKILAPASPARSALDATRARLFDEAPPAPSLRFELDSVYQGQEALVRVDASVRDRRPYAMAFVDIRMPPGWDGVETIERLWSADPRLQVVICTAYCDTPWEEVLQRLDARDRLLILKKPFDNIEVQQLASTLCAKWRMAQREVDERRHLESQLVQAERLASIGQLAAGIAHEINNPMGYISSNFTTLEGYLSDLMAMLSAYEAAEARLGAGEVALQLRRLRERLQLDELKADVAGLMGESQEGIQRVRQIVQDLKDFSRVDTGQDWQWADLHKGIDSTLTIVASEVRYKADVVKRYGTLPEVWCLPSQLNQVILNLVLNAVQAIGRQRGEIAIATGVERDRVWIEIADTGCGIAPESRSRIFDPFFTTKPVGQGTGLGLSLSYGIVQKHRGRIEVDSEVGRGSRFRVWLPVRPVDAGATMT
jgi:two-component system NtrC family sensor kinase